MADAPIPVRIPPETVARVKALAPRMVLAGDPPSLSVALRAIIDRGLDAFEAELPPTKGAPDA